jgi:hypothetical protein
MPLMRSRILFQPSELHSVVGMVSDSDEVNRFAYVLKDWTDELSSQHSSWGIGQERH